MGVYEQMPIKQKTLSCDTARRIAQAFCNRGSKLSHGCWNQKWPWFFSVMHHFLGKCNYLQLIFLKNSGRRGGYREKTKVILGYGANNYIAINDQTTVFLSVQTHVIKWMWRRSVLDIKNFNSSKKPQKSHLLL